MPKVESQPANNEETKPQVLASPEASANAKAYQLVAQSAALVVQDATDHLRNMNSITSTAIGVALARLMETGDPKFADLITLAQNINTQVTNNYQTIGEKAAEVLARFPAE